MKVLIAAPICENKNYSINDWLMTVAKIMRRNPSTTIDFCFGVNNSSQEYEDKLKTIELTPFGPRIIKRPIVLRLNQSKLPEYKESIPIIIGRQREQLRKHAVENDYDWMLWLDTDIIPPIDILERGLTHGKPFISGVYTYKGTDSVVATWVVDKEKDLCSNVPFNKVIERGLKDEIIQIRGCGFGCVLLHKNVFTKIPFEWNLTSEQSEDIRYCQRCNEAGVEIWLDPKLMCLHLSDSLYEVEKDDKK